MVFQLVRTVFAQGYTGSWHALDIAFNETADRPTTRTNDDELAAWNPGRTCFAKSMSSTADMLWSRIRKDRILASTSHA